MRGITEEDINSVKYFHEVKDITRWGQWEEKRKYFCLHYPELIKAMNQLEIAQDTLDTIIEGLEYEDD